MRKAYILIAAICLCITSVLGVSCAGGEKECVHEYEMTQETPPTCTEQGSKRYECKKCGETYSGRNKTCDVYGKRLKSAGMRSL